MCMIKLRRKNPSATLSCKYLMYIKKFKKEKPNASLSCKYLIRIIKQNLLYIQIIEI